MKSREDARALRTKRFGTLFLRFFISMLLCYAPLLGALQVVNYVNMRHVLDQELYKANLASVSKAKAVVDMLRRNALTAMKQFSVQEDVYLFLTRKHDTPPTFSQVQRIRNIHNELCAFQRFSPYESIVIYSRLNQYFISTNLGGTSVLHYPDSALLKVAEEENVGMASASYTYRTYVKKYMGEQAQGLTILMGLSSTSNPREGLIALNISAEQFNLLLVDAQTDYAGEILMIDERGRILLDTSGEAQGLLLEEAFDSPGLLLEIGQSPQGAKTVRVDGKSMQVIWSVSDLDPMIYLQMVPYLQYSSIFLDLLRSSALFAGGGFVIVLLLSYVLARYVHRPVRQIHHMIENPESRLTAHGHDAETRYILMKIMMTYDKNLHLEEENLRHFGALRQAQANILQTQITPHFLYNTLQSIHMMILMETGSKASQSQAAQAVLALSAISRALLERSTDRIPLREEIDYLNQYIYIRKLCYEHRLDFQMDVPEALTAYAVPKLCLQPLVENSIRHAFSIHERCILRVSITQEGDAMVLTVDDNGEGIEESRIRQMNDLFRQDVIFRDQHVGLINLAQRLRLLYDSRANMLLRKSGLGGLRVTISLPLEQVEPPDAT